MALDAYNAAVTAYITLTPGPMLPNPNKRCPDEVMGVEENGFAIFDDGAVLLLSDVGEHYSMLSKSPQASMDSLRSLHQNQILHGDDRVENVVSSVWLYCNLKLAILLILSLGDTVVQNNVPLNNIIPPWGFCQ
jgi:hypothetical protein